MTDEVLYGVVRSIIGKCHNLLSTEALNFPSIFDFLFFLPFFFPFKCFLPFCFPLPTLLPFSILCFSRISGSASAFFGHMSVHVRPNQPTLTN